MSSEDLERDESRVDSIVKGIIERREEIVSRFGQAYLASLSITENVSLSELIQEVELHEQETREGGKFGFIYWFERRKTL